VNLLKNKGGNQMVTEFIFRILNFFKKEKKEDEWDIVNGEIIYKTPDNLKTDHNQNITSSMEESKGTELTEEHEMDIDLKKGRPPKIEKFYIYLKSSGHSASTVKTYTYSINYWEEVAKINHKSIYNLNIDDIEEAIENMDLNTKRKKISALKQLARWYARNEFPRLHVELDKLVIIGHKTRLPAAKGEMEFIRIREEAKRLIKENKCFRKSFK
jgi:hypothetical protein